MKKFCLLITVAVFFLTTQAWAADPVTPVISHSTQGTKLIVSWTEVPNATGYTFYYAPYPNAESIYSVPWDGTSFSIHLFDGAAFYIAVRASNCFDNSCYSNIDHFTIQATPTTTPKFTAADFNDLTYYFINEHDGEWETATVAFASDGTNMGADRLENPLVTEDFTFKWEIDAQGRLYIAESYYTLTARKDGFLETCWGETPAEADADPCDSPETWYTDFAAANAKVSLPPSSQ